MTHAVAMRQSQKNPHKELSKSIHDADIRMLDLFIERAEGIQSDLGDLIRAMDRVRMDKIASSNPVPQDFLAMASKAANEKE